MLAFGAAAVARTGSRSPAAAMFSIARAGSGAAAFFLDFVFAFDPFTLDVFASLVVVFGLDDFLDERLSG